jgi:hypothetical protein
VTGCLGSMMTVGVASVAAAPSPPRRHIEWALWQGCQSNSVLMSHFVAAAVVGLGVA